MVINYDSIPGRVLRTIVFDEKMTPVIHLGDVEYPGPLFKKPIATTSEIENLLKELSGMKSCIGYGNNDRMSSLYTADRSADCSFLHQNTSDRCDGCLRARKAFLQQQRRRSLSEDRLKSELAQMRNEKRNSVRAMARR